MCNVLNLGLPVLISAVYIYIDMENRRKIYPKHTLLNVKINIDYPTHVSSKLLLPATTRRVSP